MKLYLNIFLIWLLSQVDCWKPISHPASFSVYQTFPDLESDSISRSSNNNAIQKDSVDSLLDSFNKNDFADDVSNFVELRKAEALVSFSHMKIMLQCIDRS